MTDELNLCPGCAAGDHIWTMLNECRCPFCLCMARRFAAGVDETEKP